MGNKLTEVMFSTVLNFCFYFAIFSIFYYYIESVYQFDKFFEENASEYANETFDFIVGEYHVLWREIEPVLELSFLFDVTIF